MTFVKLQTKILKVFSFYDNMMYTGSIICVNDDLCLWIFLYTILNDLVSLVGMLLDVFIANLQCHVKNTFCEIFHAVFCV
jgi:hypothetical protein